MPAFSPELSPPLASAVTVGVGVAGAVDPVGVGTKRVIVWIGLPAKTHLAPAHTTI
jgi:hypothetical protein